MTNAHIPAIRRAHLLLMPGLMILISVVSSCGWQLRGASDLPPEMAHVYVEGLSRKNRFVQDLDRELAFADGGVTRDPESAGVILKVLDDQFERRVVSLSEEGKATEYELIYRIRVELEKPDGSSLLPTQTIEIRRAYFNPQVRVIGKSEEESQIRRDMYKEAVRTLLRRTEIALSHSSSP
jgi:LPS-assembly lipoprotein